MLRRQIDGGYDAVMRDIEQETRQSIIITRLLLLCLRALQLWHRQDRNIEKIFPELLVGMAILVRTARQQTPCSASALSRITGMSRQTVRRRANDLVRFGVLSKSDDGYAFNVGYLGNKADNRHVRRTRSAILAAAALLQR
ncbi:hypothetical protein [Bradyrhizobium diazoefficiens]